MDVCVCVVESGRYLALDLGGTNFRVLVVELKGQRYKEPHVTSKLFFIPARIMLGTAAMARHNVDLYYCIAFSALTLLVERREEHLACKN